MKVYCSVHRQEVQFVLDIKKGGLISDQTLDLMLTHLSQLSDKATLVVLKYMLNRLERNANKAVDRYIELNPDKEDVVASIKVSITD